ncbi:MAG: hypothetical protein ACIARR_02615 [Phycisphaerales bacterium JB059]
MSLVLGCVCHRVSFAELLALADRLDPERSLGENALIEALSARTRCCTGCGTCRPYLRLALRTGQTRLPLMGVEQARRADRPPEGESPNANRAGR